MTVSSVARLQGATGWSAECDYGISWPYSLNFSVGCARELEPNHIIMLTILCMR